MTWEWRAKALDLPGPDAFVVSVVVLVGCVAPPPGSARAAERPAATAPAYKPTLTPWGTPDLGGTWSNASQTKLERETQYGARVEMSPEEVRRVEGDRQALVARQRQPTDPNGPGGGCEAKGYDTGPACGYNGAWTDPGDTVMRVGGKPRTSFITSTPDGAVPATKAGLQVSLVTDGRQDRTVAQREGGARGPSGRPLRPGVGPSDNPESRALGERCLLSFGYSSGPVMLPQQYNSNYVFVQTKDVLAIEVEMVHDVRQIRIGAKHRNDGVRPWMGDSIGWWDGETLVAETTHYNLQETFYGSDENLKVTERFTRVAPDRILYQFKVEDPTVWAEPWSGEYEFAPSKGPIYEYACHEGNYGLVGILAGARAEEAAAKASAAQAQSASR